MDAMASQITSLTIVYSTVYSVEDQRKHQSSALLAFVRGIHRWPVNSPHKWPVTRKTFPFDDVIMRTSAVIIPQVDLRTFTPGEPHRNIVLDEIRWNIIKFGHRWENPSTRFRNPWHGKVIRYHCRSRSICVNVVQRCAAALEYARLWPIIINMYVIRNTLGPKWWERF